MKNITLSVEEDVLTIVKRRASEQNTTVNALVREYLTNFARQDDQARRARARLLELSAESEGELGDKAWTRDSLHDC